MRNEYHRNQSDREGCRVGGDPDDRRDEGQRVHQDVGEEGAARDGVRAEPEGLVASLPVGLEEVVADKVADNEDGEDLFPPHEATLPLG